MNFPPKNHIAFSDFEKAIKRSLPIPMQKTFKSFFTSIYKTKFFLPNLGHIKVESKKIGKKFTFQILEINPTEDAYLDVTALKSIVGFSFYVEGKAKGLLIDQNIEVPMIVDTGIICVSNYGRSSIQLYKNQPFTNVNLFIRSNDFIDFMGDTLHDLPEEFCTSLEDDRKYYGIGGPTTTKIHQLLLDLRQDNFEGPSAMFLRESAAMKIMGIQLAELIYNTHTDNSGESEKLQLAHTIMKNSLVDPPKIRALARQIGLSEFKLKNGFKKRFQMPIYAFLIDCRMKKAVELLTKESYSVKETAYSVGYSNPNSFSNAFYKKYGVYPTEFVKNRLVYRARS
ncbi:helix-turn-helix domain-containing protein [Aureispira anguillae]|uniref:AraC family transcriptional regulator n=1 Tax=Aureispira anguillae TaxID=2864201 RepID=A0A915YJW7_9BACT|nr:AraC family transcriptional regulator [Aureispira anguillae]BDS14564.1 AraC family transcriptional regulator [Aureispira anguillae]